MSVVEQYLPALLQILPSLTILLLVIIVLRVLIGFVGRRRGDGDYKRTLIPQFLMVAVAAVGLIMIVVSLPMSDTTRGQILGLLGVVFTGVIALASTTFVTNALAGLMLRWIRNYRSGDFIRVEDKFGRVTERGLFHTEIQDDERDLITFPNLYLVTNPMTVLRSSGTIISASLSLGYDIPHPRVEENLISAGIKAGLKEPFMQVMQLGDFSITYKISGFLPETKRLLAARSNLNRCVLDELHQAGIEIVSPNFMNQRILPQEVPVIPQSEVPHDLVRNTENAELPETAIFDKAETVVEKDRLCAKLTELQKQLAELKKEPEAKEDGTRERLQNAIARIQKRIENYEQLLKEDREFKKV